jgi:hypothetical protein
MAKLTKDGETLRPENASWLEVHSEYPTHVEATDLLVAFVAEFGKADQGEWQIRAGVYDLAEGVKFAPGDSVPS